MILVNSHSQHLFESHEGRHWEWYKEWEPHQNIPEGNILQVLNLKQRLINSRQPTLTLPPTINPLGPIFCTQKFFESKEFFWTKMIFRGASLSKIWPVTHWLTLSLTHPVNQSHFWSRLPKDCFMVVAKTFQSSIKVLSKVLSEFF